MSSKKIVQDCAARDAHLLVGRRAVKPGRVGRHEERGDALVCPAALSVIVKRTMASAFGPLVIQFFEPLMT